MDDYIQKLGFFLAKRESDGSPIRIFMYQKMIGVVARGSASYSPGMKYLRTIDGHPVNMVAKGRYEIASGVFATSDDPNAP